MLCVLRLLVREEDKEIPPGKQASPPPLFDLASIKKNKRKEETSSSRPARMYIYLLARGKVRTQDTFDS